MTYSVGSLVKVRGRDWVVLPPEEKGWYLLKPLGGTDAETVSVSPELETIEPAAFVLPDPAGAGDARSCALLRDAARLGFRSTSGPFRSFGRIAVEPRPYQLVPLLMAMKQETARLLIADDVGIGKTVEAALIARELLDRGEVSRMAVLCPPQLAEQWQDELDEKFHIRAELVLPSTVSRLERGLNVGTSLFEVHPFTIVSLDYIKSQRHRDEFLRVCPELVIVDEAHTCASASGNRNAQQRYDLVRRIAADTKRHMLFVTATPHSGKDDVFRSLLSFLDPAFASLPDDLAGKENEAARRNLAHYFVQRRRGDIRAYMDEATPFPERVAGEMTWRFSPAEHAYFQSILSLARESVKLGEGKDQYSQRVFWWSALALLRAVTSSPAAAKATLRSRAGLGSEGRDVEQLDAEARQMVYDLTFTDDSAVTDTLAGADSSDAALDIAEEARSTLRRRYAQLARGAEELISSDSDSKLKGAVEIVKKLLGEGYSPVVFCRFIHTAEYVAEALKKALPRAAVAPVTGMLAPEERENRVDQLSQEQQRVLVCTDCLSEGINLQKAFNAVLHYDLSWNPTRHEQREGRVDRFGQPFRQVKVITYYGEDNPIDGYVLDVLLRKHESIRKALGISVPFPEDSDKVMQAILQGLLLKGGRKRQEETASLFLPGMEDFFNPEKKRLEQEWEALAAKEQKRSRTVFAQQTIKVDDVAREISAANEAVGSVQDVERVVCGAVRLLGGTDRPGAGEARARHEFFFDRQVFRSRRGLELPEKISAAFSPPVRPGEILLTRTHPFVEKLAAYVFDTAMEQLPGSIASRCGVMRTDAVQTRTTLLLCRFRYELRTTGVGRNHEDLTEDCAMLAFSGSPQKAAWLGGSEVQKLLRAEPRQNVDDSTRQNFLAKVIEGFELLRPHIREVMEQRADAFLDAHRRVRTASRITGLRYDVSPQGEPDILGIYVYLPVMNNSGTEASHA